MSGIDLQNKLPKFEDLKVMESAEKGLTPPPVPMHEPEDKNYGIDNAIALMKKLPEADMRILATVIKETLLNPLTSKYRTLLKMLRQKKIVWKSKSRNLTLRLKT